jgi:type I restriction enzyme R subunit
MAIPTDPNEMGDARRALAAFGVIWESEIPPVVAALSSDASDAQAKAYAGLDSALERFGALTVEQQDEFRDALKRFINVYSFMSQVVPYTDRQLEDWYVYSRALRSVLPHESGQGTIDVSSKVELTHLKVALAEDETDVSLDADAGELEVIFGDGRHFEPDEETLAEIIRQINERLGRTLTKADRIVFEQMEQDWLEDDQLFAQANANDLENFALAFTKVFEASMLARLGKNEDLVMKILDAPEIKEALEAFYVDRVYHSLREDEKALTTFV